MIRCLLDRTHDLALRVISLDELAAAVLSSGEDEALRNLASRAGERSSSRKGRDRVQGGYHALSFQEENSQENFRISGSFLSVIYKEYSAFLVILKKVLPHCVMAGPGEPKSAPRRAGLAPGPSGLAGRARQSTIPRRLARLPHAGRMIRCQMR